MSLLDTASLIVTPNGYKEGKLYSVIPSDGSGDMSVVRATTATRVNSAGLVELVPYNLLEYSQDFSNAYWVGEPGNTITSNTTTAPDGTLTADTFTATASNELNVHNLNGLTLANGTFTYSVYLKNNGTNLIEAYLFKIGIGFAARGEINFSAGTFTASIGTGSIENVGNGWFRVSLTNTYTSGFFTTGTYTTSTTGTRSVFAWGAQLVEGSTALPYQKTETRLNIPRLDYSNGTCPSLLVEPQRTNVMTYSEDFGEWSASAGGISSIEANYAISPDGVINAYKVNFVVQNDSDLALYRGHSVTGGATYAYSIYIKGEGGNIGKDIVLKSKRSGGDSAGTTTTQTLTGEWARVDFTTTYAANNTVANFYISSNDATSCLVYGAQVELGSYSTSYIPTTSASVTRNADVISKTGISSLIGQTEGTMFVEVNSEYLESYTQRVFTLFDGTSSNILGFLLTASNELLYYVANGGTNQVIITKNSPAITLGQNVKIAAAYKANDFVLYVNGVQIGTDTSGSVPATNSVRFANFDGSSQYVGKINAAALWKTRLTNDELATLTTI
jgi:hypothetical protein